jgi:hypothetical protein
MEHDNLQVIARRHGNTDSDSDVLDDGCWIKMKWVKTHHLSKY